MMVRSGSNEHACGFWLLFGWNELSGSLGCAKLKINCPDLLPLVQAGVTLCVRGILDITFY